MLLSSYDKQYIEELDYDVEFWQKSELTNEQFVENILMAISED